MKSIAASITVVAGALLWMAGALASNHAEFAMIGGVALTILGFGAFVAIAGRRD
jgi:hypothetical protein